MPTPYLFFNGRTEEALEFYRKALDAKVQMVMKFKDSPEAPPPGMEADPNHVMHACIVVGGGAVMASDGCTGGKPEFKGFSLSYDAKDPADAKRRFSALADGGQVQMPLAETFFAQSFGSVTDKFGVSWMVIAGPKNP